MLQFVKNNSCPVFSRLHGTLTLVIAALLLSLRSNCSNCFKMAKLRRLNNSKSLDSGAFYSLCALASALTNLKNVQTSASRNAPRALWLNASNGRIIKGDLASVY